MNDQTRWRTDDAAPLQGKVTLEPAPSMASEAQPPAPARRLEEESFEPLDALDELTEVEPALNVRPRRRHRPVPSTHSTPPRD